MCPSVGTIPFEMTPARVRQTLNIRAARADGRGMHMQTPARCHATYPGVTRRAMGVCSTRGGAIERALTSAAQRVIGQAP